MNIATVKEIVEYVRSHNMASRAHTDVLDAMLHARAKFFEDGIDGMDALLTWAVTGVESAARRLREASAEDAGRVNDAVLGAQRLTLTSSLCGFSWAASRSDVCRVQLEDAVETLRRILSVYERTAKDVS